MAVIREHLAHKGLGLHNDLQNEASAVGNFPFVHMMLEYGPQAQKQKLLEPMLAPQEADRFGLTGGARQRRHLDGNHGGARRG